MWNNLFIFLIVFHYVGFANCAYTPIGDEVQSGSVLLPASRRGRYLANMARRQAVDGTGIKFNKNADRMNAEAKKKVDVLSEELLPYIIAEQERRTTLYKRVMTAIQNGEKGVTIAEIRNKPPTIIRKGLMYRCPTNRAPREPDGSGVIMCEDDVDPTPIMFESCLSAEDKELYVADNKYFFCNRHRIEGPDLPRNGTSVIGCPPAERTPLNYTTQKCALEDTDDVVVHYRYYPDRTYKFVSKLDPDREVCEHWNPCQVGYIFGLAGPDQATPATELWKIVPPVPEDNNNETVTLGQNYVTSRRRVPIPPGFEYHGISKYLPNALPRRVSSRDGVLDNFDNIEVKNETGDDYVTITMIFRPMRPEDVTMYYVRFEEIARRGIFVHRPLVTLSLGQTRITPQVKLWLPPQKLNATSINYTCDCCVLRGIMLHAADGSARLLEVEKYRLRKFNDDQGVQQSVIDLDTELITLRDFGDYLLIIQNYDGSEEKVKALTLKRMRLTPQVKLWLPPQKLNATSINYTCDFDCVLGGIMLRAADGSVRLLKEEKYRLRKFNDDQGVQQSVIDLDTELITLRDLGDYLLVIQNDDGSEEKVKALTLKRMRITPQVKLWLPPQKLNATSFNYTCYFDYVLAGIKLHAAGGSVRLLEEKKYRLRKMDDDQGVQQSVIDLDTELITLRDFGDYFLIIQHDDGKTDEVKALTLKRIQLKKLFWSPILGEPWTTRINFTCDDCELMDVLCHGVSQVPPKLNIDPILKQIVFHSPKYKDDHACVYVGLFKIGNDTYRKILTIISNGTMDTKWNVRKIVSEGASIEEEIKYNCTGECILTKVTVNGIPLETRTRRSNVGSVAYYLPEKSAVTIGITEYHSLYEGVYQGVFMVDGRQITKYLCEILGSSKVLGRPKSLSHQNIDSAESDEMEPEWLPGEEQTRRSGGKTKQSCTVHILRASVPAGHAYKQKTVGYACPGGELVSVSCRGQNVTTGLGISTNNTINIDFDHFEDTNACVYMGIFKVGQTEHRKTLAVLEMINVTVSDAVPPPPSGEFKHTVVYTCNVAKCDPAMIYINDKTLKSDDKNPLYSYKSEMVKGNNTEILTVTINFSIKPFTKEYEGVYQLVVTNGTERVTKNIMEIGALI